MMKYILQLALKNVLRSKKRALLTLIMITFGVTLFIFISGMMTGWDRSSFENVINFETGHLKVRHIKFDKDRPYDLDYLVENPNAVTRVLDSKEYVKGYTKRITFFTEIDNGVDSTPIMGVGIDYETDDKVFNLKKFIVEGELAPDGALIGTELAKEMGLLLGDEFYLTFRDKYGMYTSITTWVSGLIFSPDPASNMAKAYLRTDFLTEYLSTDLPGEITIMTDSVEGALEYETELKAELPAYKVESWKSISHGFAELTEMKKQYSSGIVFLILIIAMIGVVNTILISVYEKRREIGTLKAMGMKDREVTNLFIAEGLLIGFAGSVFGCIVGAIVNIYFVTVGIDFTEIMKGAGGSGSMAMIGVIKSTYVAGDFVTAIVLCTFGSVFASWLPARKVMKMQPVECLRTVR
ncbi:MAG: FtsX-like permease family protein [Leptospirales bacterium]